MHKTDIVCNTAYKHQMYWITESNGIDFYGCLACQHGYVMQDGVLERIK